MNSEILTQIGLNKTQANVYHILLTKGEVTASELAEASGVTRTNTYEVLKQLEQSQLITQEKVGGKTVYKIENPIAFTNLLNKKRAKITEYTKALHLHLKDLQSMYSLVRHKPGVTYLEGVEGFAAVYDDMLRRAKEILIFPSQHSTDDPEVAKIIAHNIVQQKKQKITTKALFSEELRNSTNTIELAENNVEVRFWNTRLQYAQIAIYADTVVITDFADGVMSTVITSEAIAQTQRLIFEEAWSNAFKQR